MFWRSNYPFTISIFSLLLHLPPVALYPVTDSARKKDSEYIFPSWENLVSLCSCCPIQMSKKAFDGKENKQNGGVEQKTAPGRWERSRKAQSCEENILSLAECAFAQSIMERKSLSNIINISSSSGYAHTHKWLKFHSCGLYCISTTLNYIYSLVSCQVATCFLFFPGGS